MRFYSFCGSEIQIVRKNTHLIMSTCIEDLICLRNLGLKITCRTSLFLCSLKAMVLLWRLGKTALKWKRTVGKWPNTSHLIRLSANVVYSTEDFMHFLSNSTVTLHHSISPARHLFYFPGWNIEGWPCSADCLGGALKESYLLLQQMWMIFREMLTLYCESLSLSGKNKEFPLAC